MEGDSTAPHLVKGRVQLYDLEQEVVESDSTSANLNPRGEQDERITLGQKYEVMGSGHDDDRSESAITCNSTPMVREKLSGERPEWLPPIQLSHVLSTFPGPSDFVYDLYYTNLCSIWEMDAW